MRPNGPPSKKLSGAQRRSLSLGEYVKREKLPLEAAAITLRNASQKASYQPASDGAFYRNDGHKNILSRGALC